MREIFFGALFFGLLIGISAKAEETPPSPSFPVFETEPVGCEHFELISVIFDGSVLIDNLLFGTNPAKIYTLNEKLFLVEWRGEEACVYKEYGK